MKQFLLISGIQGLFVGLIIYRMANPANKKANSFLAMLVWVVSSFLLVQSQGTYFSEYPKLFMVSYVLTSMFCPIYYLYQRSVSSKDFKFSGAQWLVFVPSFTYLALLFPYLLLSNENLISTLRSADLTDLLMSDFVAVIANFYFLWASWKLIKGRKSDETINAAEFRIFVGFQAGVALVLICWSVFLFMQLGWLPAIAFRQTLVYLAMSGLVFFLAYVLMAQNFFFTRKKETGEQRYKHVSIDVSETELIGRQILSYLEETKAYKQPDFSLASLSELTGVDRFKLSYTINNALDTTFNSLINQYRIKEFIELSRSNHFRHYTMLGVANEAGFKSKSTFYKAFKDLEGCTPKEYLDSLSNEEIPDRAEAVSF